MAGSSRGAAVIATGVTADGGWEVLGWDVGYNEVGASWTAFLHSLEAHGLHGIQPMVSDAHTGLRYAVATVMAGTCWQRPSPPPQCARSERQGISRDARLRHAHTLGPVATMLADASET